MEKIRVVGVIVPEVVLVVLALPVPLDHHVEGSGEPQGGVDVEDGPEDVEVGPEGAHELEVGVVRERLVSPDVGEGLSELEDAVHHEAEGAVDEDSHSRAGEGSPLAVEVGLNVVVEHSVATPDRVSAHSLSEIAGLLGETLDLVKRRARIAFEEAQVGLV
eukprot:CAMPEP_0168613650 /NCGR_PEP_ID=MMETSP0449_2-20121227/3563_1 /TAXON_ID=1082188 /ORGANISM="Strombidium rassoulzadegani, Strain ras09" /LENGTH=160 /DNA_ID=CAMNT_0008654295 /DNA_START=290 /DNA_END=772 /DNA_ORIENTATION=-